MKQSRYLNKCITLMGILVIIAITQASPIRPARAQQATPVPTIMSNTTMSVGFSKPVVAPGEEFDILVNLTTDTPTAAAQLVLIFDPNLIEISDVAEGTFYSQFAQANGLSTFVVPSPADNNAGKAVFAVTLLGYTPGNGATGTGTLVTYRARAKPEANGNVDVKMEEVIVADSANNEAQISQKLGGVKIQNGVLTVSSESVAAPEQPAPEAVLEPTNPPEPPTPEPTVARRGEATNNEQSSANNANTLGIPWLVVTPVFGVVIIGALVLMLSRRRK